MKPITRLRTVDLPAPEGPTSAIVSPGATVSEKSCSAASFDSGYTKLTFSNWNPPWTESIGALPSLFSRSGHCSTSPMERIDSRPLVTCGAMPTKPSTEPVMSP